VDDESFSEAVKELGVVGFLALLLIIVVFLPAVLFLWYFSEKPDAKTSSIAALGGVLNVLFLVVVTVLFVFRRPLTGGVYLIWEASLVMVLLGIGRSMFVMDEADAEADRTEPDETEPSGWRGWLWDADRPWTRETSRRRVGNDEGARVGRQAASDGSGRQRAGGATAAGGRDGTGRRRTASDGASGRSATSDREETDRSHGGTSERETRDHNRAWSGDPQSFDGDPLTRTVRAGEVLGVDPNASTETIETAYRERVKEAHPDAGGSTEEFIAVKEAYRVLTGEDR